MMTETYPPVVGSHQTGGRLYRLPLSGAWAQIPHIRTGLRTSDRLIFDAYQKPIGYLTLTQTGRYRVFPCKDWRSLIDSISNGETEHIAVVSSMGWAVSVLADYWEKKR